jgi:predicted ATP-dependent endonuclease of OLD family
MRIVRVEVERFMGLRRVALEVDPSLQLVAGPNNSGKTTLLRALEFFSNPAEVSLGRIKPQNTYYSKEGPRALTKVRLYFGKLTPQEEKLFQKTILKQSWPTSITFPHRRQSNFPIAIGS